MAPDPVLLTTGQAAKRLSVSPNTVRRWASLGQIRHVLMPSGQIRFREQDVESVLAVREPSQAAS